MFLRMPKGFKSIFLPVFVATFVVMLLMQARPVFADTPAAVISPSGGSYTTAQSVTIGTIPSGDTAYYTTDGSNPETSGTLITYTGAFTVSQSETVQAAIHGSVRLGQRDHGHLRHHSSSQAPVISPSGGSFTTAQSVTISNITRYRLLHHRRAPIRRPAARASPTPCHSR